MILRDAPVIRSCERCHGPIVSGQRYETWTSKGYPLQQHAGLVGCLVSMLVRASRHVGG